MTRLARTSAAIIVAATMLVGCGDTSIATFPPVSLGPDPISAATTETRHLIEVALSAQGLQAGPPATQFRPAESASLAAAPRLLLQVLLPDDPDHGYVTVYELSDATTAEAAAREQAAYIGSGIGRVQFPPDSQFVVRTVGATVIFFSWSAENSPDPRTPKIASALETVGTGVPIPP
jgi:hypothetical protein